MLLEKLPDLKYLKSLFTWNEDGGLFWKKRMNNRIKIGDNAGTLMVSEHRHIKYHVVTINQKKYKKDRILFYLYTGINPENQFIEHIDRNELNYSKQNLRVSKKIFHKTRKNRHNKTSKFKGVSAYYPKWEAAIYKGYQKIYLGRYKSEFYAAVVYARALRNL